MFLNYTKHQSSNLLFGRKRQVGIRDSFISGDGFEFEAGEAVTADTAADEHGPFVGGATDEAEVGVVGASAAVGAAGHAEEDGFVFEAEIAEGGVDGIHEPRQGAFGLAEGEAAGGEGDAGGGDGAGAGEADVVGVGDAGFCEEGGGFGLSLSPIPIRHFAPIRTL